MCLPRLGDWKDPGRSCMPILLLHSLRHLGLMFLTPGATYPGIPPQFAYPAAAGDLLAAVLAFASLLAVAGSRKGARALVWVFNVEGSVDLVVAIVLATVYGAPAYMGPAYWIPAFWVPALLVTHYITFVLLLHGIASSGRATDDAGRHREVSGVPADGVRGDGDAFHPGFVNTRSLMRGECRVQKHQDPV